MDASELTKTLLLAVVVTVAVSTEGDVSSGTLRSVKVVSVESVTFN